MEDELIRFVYKKCKYKLKDEKDISHFSKELTSESTELDTDEVVDSKDYFNEFTFVKSKK